MQVVRMPHYPANWPLPAYESAGAAGMDLRACHGALLASGARVAMPTGLCIAIPTGLVGLVCARSGLATKHGMTCIPSPGVIDSDYRGEITVTMLNLNVQSYEITRGDRIAQLVITPVSHLKWEEVGKLPATKRGEGGFGSTGNA